MAVYLVCFDISDDLIRNRVGRHLLLYGNRVQKSVFEISVKRNEELETIKQNLLNLVGDGETNIRFYRVCANCRAVSSTLLGDAVAHFPAMIVL